METWKDKRENIEEECERPQEKCTNEYQRSRYCFERSMNTSRSNRPTDA